MKKLIYTLVACFAISALFTSCLKDENDLFADSASLRMQKSIDKYNKMLASTCDGWILEYYPHKDLIYGGFTYTVAFDKNQKVKVGAEIAKDVNDREETMYQVIANSGPTLTFDTYNTFMHHFANPSADEYQGKGGEYEFLINSANGDTINLTGKKFGNKMRLIKLHEPYSNYLAKVVALAPKLELFSNIVVKVNGEVVKAESSKRILTFTTTENEETTENQYPYLITDKGIRFYEDVTINGVTFRDLQYDADKDLLQSADGKVVIKIIKPPFKFNKVWVIVAKDKLASPSALAAFKKATDGDALFNGELAQDAFFGNTGFRGYIGIRFRSKDLALKETYSAIYQLKFKGVEEPNILKIEKDGPGMNWKWYTQLMPFVDYIVDNSPYKMEVLGKDKTTGEPAAYKLSSVETPENWFCIILQN